MTKTQSIFKFERRKLRKSKSFYICFAIMLGLVLILALSEKFLLENNPDIRIALPANGIEFMLSAISASSFTIIVGIFVAISVCNDFDEGTIKNIYSRGYSRNQVFFSKLVSILVSTSIMFFGVHLVAFGVGALVFGMDGINDARFVLNLLTLYLVSIAIVVMFFSLSFCFKKVGTSIAMNIVTPIAASVLLTLFDSVLNWEDFKVADLWLTDYPTALAKISCSLQSFLIAIIGSVVFIVAFLILGFHRNKKLEV